MEVCSSSSCYLTIYTAQVLLHPGDFSSTLFWVWYSLSDRLTISKHSFIILPQEMLHQRFGGLGSFGWVCLVGWFVFFVYLQLKIHFLHHRLVENFFFFCPEVFHATIRKTVCQFLVGLTSTLLFLWTVLWSDLIFLFFFLMEFNIKLYFFVWCSGFGSPK